jgi:Primase C terminal 2 (PriCT-2)
VRAALDAIPNHADLDRAAWLDIGMAVHSGTGASEEGFEAFDEWSSRWEGGGYDEEETRRVWDSFEPHSITAGTLFHLADQADPNWRSKIVVEPTYPATNTMPVEQARQVLEQNIDTCIEIAAAWSEEQASDCPFIRYGTSDDQPPVHAMRVSTGIGKTQRFAARLARHVLARRGAGEETRPWLYLVPTHRLGEDVAEYFKREGLTAKVYRGRDAVDPEIPGNLRYLSKPSQVRMCLEREKVKLATVCGQNIESACCRSQQQRCASYDKCGYQRQLRGDEPDVWIAAHNMLFHPQKLFKKVAGAVVDETFYPHGLTGMNVRSEDVFTLDDLAAAPEQPSDSAIHNLDPAVIGDWRNGFIEALREHPPGGLQRDLLVDKVHPDDCTENITREWGVVKSVKFAPRMTENDIAEIKERVPEIRRARYMAGAWRAMRELLEMPEGTVSGRLILEEKNEKSILRHRGVREIVEARKVPTLILDATLPNASVLRAWYPQIEVVADIEVEMPPHVHIRQVLRAPVSQRKLWGTEKREAVGRNRQAIRRYILQRWLEIDRQPMLVICQMELEKWLKESGLPQGIAVEHYNAISGLDQYKGVRSLVLVGRTIPSPTICEAFAGALTGVQPRTVEPAMPSSWYDTVIRGIRLADGTGIAVEADQHPDPMAEAVRNQICEAELMQALGRARAINRTGETPLQVDILADVVLPITVNEVVGWEEPSEVIEMAIEGIVLTAPKDMAKAWPGLWATERMAKWALNKLKAAGGGAGELRTFSFESLFSLTKMSSALLYTAATTKFRRAAASFDPRTLPNPRAWLEARLGSLASLLLLVRRGEVPPMRAEGGLIVNDELVVVIKPKPRTVLDHLYPNPRARRPWRAPAWTEADRLDFIEKTKSVDVWQIAGKPAAARS